MENWQNVGQKPMKAPRFARNVFVKIIFNSQCLSRERTVQSVISFHKFPLN